ncbi:MAG: hypothetical protein JXL80_11565 [Planctomycetes bacterium]|nr:hypothetical protein [Planctomycetota bacterium]
MRVTIRLAIMLLGLTTLCSCIPISGMPGQPHVIATADYTIDAANDQPQSNVTARFSVFCHAGDQVIALLPRSVALLDWQADSGRVVPQGDSYVLVAREPGTYHLTMKFLAVRQSPTPGTSRIELPSVPANRIAVQVRLPNDSGRLVTVPQGIVTADTTEGNVRRVSVLAPLASTFALQWQKAAVSEAAETEFSVENNARLDVLSGLIERHETILCTVQRGSFDHLSLAVPEGAAVRRVQGDDVLSWSASDDGRTVNLRLGRKVDDRTVIKVVAEDLLPALPGRFTYRPVSVAAARVQQGSARFVPAQTLVLEEDAVVAATRRAGGSDGLAVLSYDYSRLPVEIGLRVSERQSRLTVAVESLAVIEAGVVTLHSELSYQIQLQPVRGVTIGLAEGATVLDVAGAFVRDWDVGEDRFLRVRFNESRLGLVKISVRTHQNIQKINGFVIPRLQPSDVASEAGIIGVSAGEGMQLRHHRATLTEQVDASELPEWIRQGGAKLAYRYRQGGGTLAVETEKIQPRITAEMADVVNLELDALMRTTTVSLTVEDDQIFEVALRMPASLTPLRVTGPRVAAWRLTPATDEGKALLVVTLTDGLTGETSLVLEATRTVDYGLPLTIGSIDLPAAQRISGRVVIVPQADLKLGVVDVQSLREASVAMRRAGEGRSPAARAVQRVATTARSLHYDFTTPWSATLRVDPLTPLVAVVADTLLKIGQGEIGAVTLLTCTIQEAGVSVLHVQLPPWAVNSWIDGDDISGRRLDPETNTWTITLATRRKGLHTLRVTYDRLIDRDASEVAHEEPRVVEAASHKGILRVGKQSDHVDVTVTPSGHARAIETVAETASGGLPLVRAIEYSGQAPRDWGLSLKMAQLGEADVLKIQASDCLLQTMINRDGMAVTFMTLTVQNTRQQFAPIELPDSRQLWGAYVDGRPVKPVEGDRPDTYRIPLLQRGARDEAFELTVVYTEQLPALEGRTVDLALKTPPVEVATGSMGWEVFMPPGYALRSDLVGDEGNMRMVIRPPDADVPVTDQMLGPDSQRWRQVWPVVRPIVEVARVVAIGLACILGLVPAVWLLARYGPRLFHRTAASGGRAVRFVQMRPALKWAAVMMLIAIPVLMVLALMMPAGLRWSGEMWEKRAEDSAVALSPLSVSASKAEHDLIIVGDALETYRGINDAYPDRLDDLTRAKLVDPDVVERLQQKGVEYFGRSLNAWASGGDTTGAQQNKDGVLLAGKDRHGYNILRPGNELQYVEEGDRRQLATELYRQGDVGNAIIEEDLRPTDEELKTYSESYRKGKMLGGKSRTRQDMNLLTQEAQRRMKRAEERYGSALEGGPVGQTRLGARVTRSTGGVETQGQPAAGAAEAPAPSGSDFTFKADTDKLNAFKDQAAGVLREAQKAANVKETKVLEDGKLELEKRIAADIRGSGEAPGDLPASTSDEQASSRTPEFMGTTARRPESGKPTKPQNGTDGPQEESEQQDGQARPAERATAQPDGGWRPWEAGGVELVSLAPVEQGRTRGSLPIGLQLPESGQLPYMFSRIGRGFSGGDMGHFRVQAVRSGSGYTVYTVAGLAVAGLLATAVRHASRQLHRGRRTAA